MFKKILYPFLFIALVFFVKFNFVSKFKSGQCVKIYRDGYIWHVNNFKLGEYRLMGWQENAWGNEVEMERGVLERDISGIPVYNLIPCPEFNLR